MTKFEKFIIIVSLVFGLWLGASFINTMASIDNIDNCAEWNCFVIMNSTADKISGVKEN